MQVKQSMLLPMSYVMVLALTISTILSTKYLGNSNALALQKSPTSKQYRSGYTAGTAEGKRVGKLDGAGEAGTNSMHTNATCGFEQPNQKDFERGYIRGCRTTYEQTFAREYKRRQKK
jgi:hypothetical protein